VVAVTLCKGPSVIVVSSYKGPMMVGSFVV
jgi:hypothetical protein